MKAIIKYQKDDVKVTIQFDNVSRVRQKGDHVTLVDRNGCKLKCSQKDLRINQREIVLLPDETDCGLGLDAYEVGGDSDGSRKEF
jgi:hypothetical protein